MSKFKRAEILDRDNGMGNILKKASPIILPIVVNEVPFKHLGAALVQIPDNHLPCVIFTRSMFKKCQAEAVSNGSTAEKMLETGGIASFVISDHINDYVMEKVMSDIMIAAKDHPYIILCREG